MKAHLIVLLLLSPSTAVAQSAGEPEQWRLWLFEIVRSIEDAHRTGNADLFERRVRRPDDFLAVASALPEERSIRIHCTLAAQSAANYSLSLRQGKSAAARADLQDYRRYDRACARAIAAR